MNIMDTNDRFLIVKGTGGNKKTSQFTQRYASAMTQLLGQIDGIEVAEIDEEQYQNSFLRISTDSNNMSSRITRCIMFGSDKFIEEQEYCTIKKYEKYGISYGWLGNDCVVHIDPRKIKSDDISDYLKYYKNKQDEAANVGFIHKGYMPETEAYARANNATKMAAKTYFHALNPFKQESIKECATDYLLAICSIPQMVIGLEKSVYLAGPKLIENSQFIESVYQVAVCDFLINGFGEFKIATRRANKKETLVVIVYNEKNYKYAQLLKNVIIEFSDYNAIIFSDKKYKDNAWGISSKNRIIFLGESEIAAQTTFTTPVIYNRYNTQFGYRGPHAFIKVGKRMSSKDISACWRDFSFDKSDLILELMNRQMDGMGYFPDGLQEKDIHDEWEDLMYKYICLNFVVYHLNNFIGD